MFSVQGERWIYSRTGVMPTFSSLNSVKQKLYKSNAQEHGPLSGPMTYNLPPRFVLEQCIEAFRASPFRLAFPVISMARFEETVQYAYEPDDLPPLEATTSKACVFSFLSICPLVFPNRDDCPILDMHEWAVKAQHYLPDILQVASVTSLEMLFMLFLHELFAGRYQPATMLHSLATRTVFALGGHHNITRKVAPSDPTGQRLARHLRNLFWLCYVFDKDISLRTGQPPLIADDDCDLTFPEGYLEQQYCFESDWGLNMDDLTPHLPADLRLNIIKAKTCRLLYSPSSLNKSDADLIRDIRMLDLELENWRQSMPDNYRPTLSIPRDSRRFQQFRLPNGMHKIVIYLEYFYLLAAIHRASGRCRVRRDKDEDGEGEGDLMIYGVTSSMELGVEASRSTVTFLKAVIEELDDASFW